MSEKFRENKKIITIEQLLEAMPEVARLHFSDLREAGNEVSLKLIMEEYWFQPRWLDDIWRNLCDCDSDNYKVRKRKNEKIDIIFQYVTIEPWKYEYEEDEELMTSQQSNAPETTCNENVKNNCSQANIEEFGEVNSNLTSSEIQEKISNFSNQFQDKSDEIENYDMTVNEGLDITFQSEFLLKTKLEISEKLVVLLAQKEDEVIGFGCLKCDNDGIYHIIMDCNNIQFDLFTPPYSYRVGLFPSDNSKVMYIKHYKIKYKKLETVSNTLCIDFGTSNTSAGTYGLLDSKANTAEIVKFESKQKLHEICPTVLYVDNCSDINNISYLFGYEALAKVQEQNYTMEASVFFELKCFMANLDEEIEIFDSEGSYQTISRAQLVEAYLLNIIKLSQQYFNVKFTNLHFSSPVKMKNLFFRGLNSMLSKHGYQIMTPNKSIDEGIAIVYCNVQKIIAYNDKNIKILILDSGGGTTDLASCEVKYKDQDASKSITFDSSFINGNSNFGGNNITYKIMQLIKIKLVEKLKNGKDIDLLQMITEDDTSILNESDRLLEKNNQKSMQSSHETFYSDLDEFNRTIYGEFQINYEECESIIPTKFATDELGKKVSSSELSKRKRNYYYMWQLAEKIKIEFYGKDIVSYDISNESNKNLELNTAMQEFYVNKDGELHSQSIGQVTITIKELHRLLCGDIYCLLNSLLLKEENKLEKYTHFKLAGQSCKISLFLELLKEFVPGRRLRLNTKIANQESVDNGSLRLKLECIEGCILYIKDMEYSSIRPTINIAQPALIYDVQVNKNGKKTLLSRTNPQKLNYESFNYDTSKVEFIICNSGNEVQRTITINLKSDEYKWNDSASLDEVFAKIDDECYIDESGKNELQHKISNLVPDIAGGKDSILFGIPVQSKEGYGINIYFIEKTKNNDEDFYRMCDTIYENFEDETTKSFFDGSK